MARDLDFDGYWQGKAYYTCDNPGCKCKSEGFRFDSEDVDSKSHRAILRKRGWITTKVNDKWKDFCGERCRNEYIRTQTF